MAEDWLEIPGRQLDAIDTAFKRIDELAATTNKEVHPSFYTELRNYALHEHVRDLEPQDLEVVLERVGQQALQVPESKFGAGVVREVLTKLCNDAFSDCSKVGKDILMRESKDRGGSTMNEA